MKLNNVYWIKKINHTDPYTEGYIGVSNNPKRRFKEHKKNNSIVGNNIRKYKDNVELHIIHENVSLEEAEKLEFSYRPKYKIGWNIMPGGFIPPNQEGILKPHMSDRFKGENNPFYGKTFSPEVLHFLSISQTGANNVFYGQKRPEHAEKLKLKFGEKYPKFQGWFITPKGIFDTVFKAADSMGISIGSIYSYCKNNCDKKINKYAIAKSTYLTIEHLGKTYRELGFDFKCK